MGIDLRITEAFEAANGFPLEPNLVVLALMGSHSHGTYLPPEDPHAVDDIDLMGFVVPPVGYHLGLARWQHWTAQIDELDVVLYSLEKATRLLLKSNPNIVGLLWLRDEEYVYRHATFGAMQAQRHIFSAQSAAAAFSGYALDQLKRMEAFDLDRMAEYESLTAQIVGVGPVKEVLEANPEKMAHISRHWSIDLPVLQRFRKLHREHFSGYMGEKRKNMVRRYSYDVKNAAHLIRLLRMGAEFVETGTLQVYRTHDADELKGIKRGGWTLDQVKAEAERLALLMEPARLRSPLQPEPNSVAADALLQQIHLHFLGLSLPAV
jgi:uncharacterized protein